MCNKNFIYIFLVLVFNQFCSGQDCKYELTGNVIDEGTMLPLSFVNVIIQESSAGAVTDKNGEFSFINVCEGEFHLIFSHVGCEDIKVHLDIESDTTLVIIMDHTATNLGTVVVKGVRDYHNNQPAENINRQEIEDNSNRSLSGLLEQQKGIQLIKNGSGISKPIVHGLFGNRLAILNNGVLQSGQQWGNDHSPEIDPYAADKITILKGVSAIQYGGGSLGSVILVEPKRIKREPHLHGQVNYTYETNGRGHSINTRLGKYSKALAWRINGSYKKYGDRHTADYFLNNTGTDELNFSLLLEKTYSDRLFLDFYASTFNTNLGVLRGSHIGNLTDLQSALTSDVPFFTEPNYDSQIEAPSQKVAHHLVKMKAKYLIDDDRSLEFVIAGQTNDRKEFDIRRSGRTDIPALSLLQHTINIESKYKCDIKTDWKFTVGQQTILTDNTNNPETGILPLIPDYFSTKAGLFSSLSRNWDHTSLNFGLRYDFENQKVVSLSNTIPREILRFDNTYHNISGLLALEYELHQHHSLGFNSGFGMRNPAVNELYSNGLHQGVSGIEEGNEHLDTEKSLKNVLEYNWVPSTQFSFNVLAYSQYFNDYIFLNPQDEVRLTIRGAFPVFKYEQTDAFINGIDIATQFNIGNSFYAEVKYSYLNGRDITNDQPLIFMPPNRIFASLLWRSKKAIKLSGISKLENLEVGISNRYIFKQSNILEDQDFIAPPDAYSLLGLKVSTNAIFPNYRIRLFANVDNLLNIKYRDYLNRQRYFADDLGRSITLGVGFKF